MVDLPVSGESIAAGSAALVGIFLALKKVLRIAAADTTGTKASEATTTIIEMMRMEMERLSKVNAELAKKVNEFQLENIALRSEIAQLTAQVNRFQKQNAELQVEVAGLTSQISEFTEVISEMQKNGFNVYPKDPS